MPDFIPISVNCGYDAPPPESVTTLYQLMTLPHGFFWLSWQCRLLQWSLWWFVVFSTFVCSSALKCGWFPSHTLNSRTYSLTSVISSDICGLHKHVRSSKLTSTKRARSMTFWLLNVSLQLTKMVLLLARLQKQLDSWLASNVHVLRMLCPVCTCIWKCDEFQNILHLCFWDC